jgi:hypothetical protein
VLPRHGAPGEHGAATVRGGVGRRGVVSHQPTHGESLGLACPRRSAVSVSLRQSP